MSRRLGMMGKEAVQEARRVQSRLVSSEIDTNHIMLQEHFGWIVHRRRPNEPEERTFLPSKIIELDQFVSSPRGINRLKMNRTAERTLAEAKRAEARRLTHMRDAARRLTVNFNEGEEEDGEE